MLHRKGVVVRLTVTALGILLAGCASIGGPTTPASESEEVPALDLPVPSLGYGAPENLQIEIRLPQDSAIPAKAAFYRFKTGFTEENAREIAQRFGLQGEPKLVDNPGRGKVFIISDDVTYYEYELDAGQYRYIVKRPPKGDVPNAAEVETIAVDKLKELGIWDDNLHLAGIGEDVEWGVNRTVTARAAQFYATMNGEPLLGVARVDVRVGAGGQVVDVMKRFRDTEPEPIMKKIRTVEQALDDLKAGDGIISYPEGKFDKMTTDVALRYWADPAPSQTYLQPVYVFTCEAEVEGKTVKFVAVERVLE